LIIDVAYKDKKPPKKLQDNLKKMTINCVDMIELETSKVGFWRNAYKQKNLRSLLDDILLYTGIDQIYHNKSKIVSELMKLAKHRTEENL
jgi:hypothetical protein